MTQPAPAPRFSRTVPGVPRLPTPPSADGTATLSSWGFTAAEVAALRADGAFGSR